MKEDLIDKYLIAAEPLTEDIIAMADLFVSMSDDEYDDFMSELDEETYPEWDSEGNLLVEDYILEKPSLKQRITKRAKQGSTSTRLKRAGSKSIDLSLKKNSKSWKASSAADRATAKMKTAGNTKMKGKFAKSATGHTKAYTKAANSAAKNMNKGIAMSQKGHAMSRAKKAIGGKVAVGAAAVAAGVAAKKLYDKAKAEREGCRKKCASKSGDDKEKCIAACRTGITKRVKAAVAKVRGKD